jgi:hypothetical protein
LCSYPLQGLAYDKVGEVRAIRTRDILTGFLGGVLGQDTHTFLAYPVERQGWGIIEWQTTVPGKISHASWLPEAGADRLRANLAEKARALAGLGKSLSVGSDRQKRTAGGVLEKLAWSIAAYLSGASVPLDFYVVGGVVVAVGWGLTELEALPPTPGQSAEIESVLRSGKSAMRPFPPARQSFARPLPPPEPAAPPPAETPPPPPPVPAKAPWAGVTLWDLLRTAVTAILTIFILLGMALALSPGVRRGLGSEAIEPPSDDGYLDRLQGELYGLRLGLFARLEECVPEEREEEGPPAIMELDKPEPIEPTLVAEGPEDPAPLYVPPPPPPGPDVGSELVIPEDPNDLSFLEGCWKSDAGLKNSSTGMPIVIIYCLDANGKGTSTIDLYDNRNRYLERCSGPATSRREGNKVIISNTGPACPKSGTRFTPDYLTCSSGKRGRTACQVENRLSRKNRSKPYYDTSFTYHGKRH